jgi:hypothetical protein
LSDASFQLVHIILSLQRGEQKRQNPPASSTEMIADNLSKRDANGFS